MKRLSIPLLVFAVAIAAVAGVIQLQSARTAVKGLPDLIPPGPILYLETDQLSQLLTHWQNSPEEKKWLASDNYAGFSRSRLFSRLGDAQGQFAAAAGVPPDTKFLQQLAGTRSALALYDIGQLEFLVVSRVDAGVFTQSDLWRQHSHFEQREIAGIPFYVRGDAATRRTVAFAVADGYLLLGTREDLVAGALARLRTDALPSVRSDQWFADAIAAASQPGDLRMALDLQRIVPSPYFRSYWVQQNITEMKQYRAAISDLYLDGDTWKEERILLPLQPLAESEGESYAAQLSGSLANVAFSKAQVTAPTDAAKMLGAWLAASQDAAGVTATVALTIAAASAQGSETDLDRRIDVSPLEPHDSDQAQHALQQTVLSAHPIASLKSYHTSLGPDGLFVRFDSALVLAAASEWNPREIEGRIADALAPQLSASHLGLTWTADSSIPAAERLNGLLPVYLAVRGHFLVLSTDPQSMRETLAHLSKLAQGSPILSSAHFDHQREAPDFKRFAALIAKTNRAAGDTPDFFSGNLVSLSDSYAGVRSIDFTERRERQNLRQSVRYQWSR